MATFRFSAFADEYSPNFDEQIKGLLENGIHLIEPRGIDGVNISDITTEKASASPQSAPRSARSIRMTISRRTR